MDSLELLDPVQHLLVLVTEEVFVGPTAVPWVEGVVADHVEGRLR